MVEPEKKLISAINNYSFPLNIMHVCGTHERTISKYGLRGVLYSDINLLSGPGCPVCITPDKDIDFIVSLARSGISIASFGDMLRVSGRTGSLMDAKSEGADVHMVYSIDDAVRIAKNHPDNELVFFGIGFETTAPTNAAALLRGLPENFSIFTSHRIIQPAMELLAENSNIDGFLAPGHVSTIIGTKPYESIAERGFPVVVTGFEPLDVLLGILMIQKQIEDGIAEVENAYPRCVTEKGNVKALRIMDKVFKVDDSSWRGFGDLKDSGLLLRKEFKEFDASFLYADICDQICNIRDTDDLCMCKDIITARAKPDQCPLFGKECTPDSPSGPCMVSVEGTCYNWYRYALSEGNINARIFTGT